MKIGLISDIHGNKNALDAVLEQLEKKNIDKIICIGDLVDGAPMLEEVVQKIISMGQKVVAVRGNRESYIIDGTPNLVHDEKIKIGDEQLYESANCKKDKLIIHGAGHTESRYKEPDIYYNKIFDFIKIVMKEV